MSWTNGGRFGEFYCEHGVGHPGLKRTVEIAKIQAIHADTILDKIYCDNLLKTCSIHGCDGCCKCDDFPGKHTAVEFDAASKELLTFLTKKWRS
jgi:hypothetical protein